MLEAELVRRRAPALVFTAAAVDRTFRPAVELSQCRAYVVAPIVTSDGVIGLVHGDAFSSGRTLTVDDRDNVQAFAAGLAVVYERVVLAERLVRQSAHVTKTLARTTSRLQELRDRTVSFAPLAVEGEDAPPAARVTFTRREREVLTLLAAGATNLEIAAELVVAETTAKFHVRQILRKLGASNRAEAVSTFLRVSRAQLRAA